MDAGLDFEFDEEQQAFRAAVDRFCAQHAVAETARQSGAPFPLALWRALAELGAFAVLVPGDTASGGAQAMCAIMETLGQHLFPGPLAATYLAAQVLDADAAAGVIDGQRLVSLSSAASTLLPWGTDADIFLLVDGANIARAHTPDFVEPVSTLGGETWGRAYLKADETFHDAARALSVGSIAAAAYLVGAAWRLLRDASAHAAIRKQFGKTLGEFQAVSHPLADCAIALSAAQLLARAAACACDQSALDNSASWRRAQHQAAGAAHSARRASLQTAYVCHQVYGGIGITLDGPAFHVSRRIRQVASSPPAGRGERELLLAAMGSGA